MGSDESCTNCRFSDLRIMSEDKEPSLICRRYPKQIVVIDDEPVMVFVHMNEPNSWCGEYRPKTEVDDG